jgi:hypothetical protein
MCGYFGYTFALLIIVDYLTVGDCEYNFAYIFWACLGSLVGLAPSLYSVDVLGRSVTQQVGYLLSVVTAAFLGLFNNTRLSIGFTGFFALTTVTGALSATWIQTAELFPTEVIFTLIDFLSSLYFFTSSANSSLLSGVVIVDAHTSC